MKIVLDTNVLLVSISRRSRHHPIFKAFEEKKYDLLVTTDILLEYEEIIGEEMSVALAHNVVMGIREAGNVQTIHKYFFWDLITIDRDDNNFVDCAIAGGADYIVTDDSHFKILKKLLFNSVYTNLQQIMQSVYREFLLAVLPILSSISAFAALYSLKLLGQNFDIFFTLHPSNFVQNYLQSFIE